MTYVYGLGLISTTDSGGNTSYYLTDGLGSTAQLTDASGNVTESYTYDEWGVPQPALASSNPFRFTGQQDDVNANRGLYYLRARFYDPALGRFLSKDPLPLLQRYAYAGDNPTSFVDPSGAFPCPGCNLVRRVAVNVGQRVIDNVTNPQSVAGDVQVVSGLIVTGCVAAIVTGDGAGFGLPLCAAASAAYGSAVAYQALNAESEHERAVILGTAGLGLLPLGRVGEVIGDALAPLAAPGVAEAPSTRGNKEKPPRSGLNVVPRGNLKP